MVYNEKEHSFGSIIEALWYPFLLIIVLWMVYWADFLFGGNFYKWGVLPKDLTGLRGIVFMPFIHSHKDIAHLVNNSFPVFILMAYVIYFYRSMALKIILISWLGTGLFLWLYAKHGGYHIGISGQIYSFAGFLFTSGLIRKYRPLQAIALFVAFYYGSMIWGIFPVKEHVSWEGHLMGLLIGVFLAVLYRNQGPKRPKYQYEIEKELGIDPPDYEGMWRAAIEQERLLQLESEEKNKQNEIDSKPIAPTEITIKYHFRPTTPRDESDPPQ